MSDRASVPSASLDRREMLRKLALAGMVAGAAGGIGTLSARGARRYFDERAATAGFTSISHQLGWLKGVQFGGCFMAQEHGYLAHEKLAVTYMAGGPTTDYKTLVASGHATISESSMTPLIDGYREGQPLIAFASVFQRSPAAFMSPMARPITSLRDMIGRTIGVPNVLLAQLSVLLRRARISSEAINFVPVGTDASMLVAGQIDAYYSLATSAVPGLKRLGFDPYVLYLSDMGMPDYGQTLIANRDDYERNFDMLVRYTAALVRGWGDLIADPVGSAKVIVDKYAQPGTSLSDQTIQAGMLRDFVLDGDGRKEGLLWINPDHLEFAIRFARDSGTIPAHFRVDMDRMMTQDVIRAARAAVKAGQA
jgi:NitT/TauT family transport system substrate-binding protein